MRLLCIFAAFLAACGPASGAIEWLYWLGVASLPLAAVAWFVGAWRAARRARLEHLTERESDREEP